MSGGATLFTPTIPRERTGATLGIQGKKSDAVIVQQIIHGISRQTGERSRSIIGPLVSNDQPKQVETEDELRASFKLVVDEKRNYFVHLQSTVVSLLQLKAPERLTEDDLRALSQEASKLLQSYVKASRLRPAQLANAAVFLGEFARGRSTELLLLEMLKHGSPLVREGVVYGLGHIGSVSATEQLRAIASGDSSPGVREAAVEVLDVM